MNLRCALYGGGTEAFELIAVGEGQEHISYPDKNSRYPTVCKQKTYLIGNPRKHYADFKELDAFFGIAVVRLIAPRNRHFSFVPQKITANVSLLFGPCMQKKRIRISAQILSRNEHLPGFALHPS